jgi:threonine aldolase
MKMRNTTRATFLERRRDRHSRIAVGVNAPPADELVCGATSHVYVWEIGGIDRLSGVTARTFEDDEASSRLTGWG